MRLAKIMVGAMAPKRGHLDLHITSDARTHVGRVRQVNEDRLLDRPEHNIWAIADGMGGHAGGDIAADLAIAALSGLAVEGRPMRRDVMEALQDGNRAIVSHNARTSGHSGATIVVLALDDRGADIYWAGDSRAYRIRGGVAEQLTRDHSVVQDLVDAGLLAAVDADRHPRSHIVTRALGAGTDVEIDHRRTDIEAGDIFLLCSDGFSRGMADDALAAEVSTHGADASALLRRAVERDGSDNVSLIVVRTITPGND